MRTIHFVAGLPRSGSTLLCNILAQRPDSFATPTSPLVGILQTLRDGWRQWHRAVPSLDSRQAGVLSAVLHSYHPTQCPIVFDKNRQWSGMVETLEAVFGREVRLLAPVRSLPQIAASMEKVWRRNIALGRVPSILSGDPQMATVRGRITRWLQPGEVIGSAIAAMEDLQARELGDRVLPVSFQQLTREPVEVLRRIEHFFGLDPHPYDFENVAQATTEDDEWHGYSGLHKIRRQVTPVPDDSEAILGPELCAELGCRSFWWEERLTPLLNRCAIP
jgi:sulfotransferase